LGLSVPGVVEVRPCPHGRGLFASKDFGAGSMIRKFEDVVLTARPGRYALQIGENEYWEGFPRGSRDYWSNFIDHSDDPNAAFSFDDGKATAWLRAVRRIGKGREIFINYTDYHPTNPSTF